MKSTTFNSRIDNRRGNLQTIAATPVPARKLSVRQAAAYLGVSKSWLDKQRLLGTGPAYMKFGRRVLYDISDLDFWAASTKRQHTSETV